MDLFTERAAFSNRLKLALARLHPPGRTGVAWLTREFNQRYNGKSISVHAARKWLLGEAIPTHDKLLALARWLKVSPDWLLFGDAAAGVRQKSAGYMHDNVLCNAIHALKADNRRIVRELVAVLSRLEGREVVELSSPDSGDS